MSALGHGIDHDCKFSDSGRSGERVVAGVPGQPSTHRGQRLGPVQRRFHDIDFFLPR